SAFIKEICVFYNTEGPQEGHLAAVIVPDEDRLLREKHVDMHFKIRWELDACASRLAPYQRIKGFVLTAQALPRTRLGKLVRYKIASLYASGQIKEPPKTAAEELGTFEATALGYLSRILKKDVRIDDHLELDLGLDSLGRIELLSSLQDVVNVGIDDTLAYELFQARTVRELIDKARRALPPDAFSGLLKREDAVSWSELLVQEPSEETRAHLKMHFDVFEKAVTMIVVFFLQFFVRIVFALRVRGKRNIPAAGSFIMASNHVSYLDAFYVLCALPFNRIVDTYFVGFGAILRHPLIAWAIRFFRMIPIDASIDLAEALKTCRYVLHQGKILVYFPEGQRSGDGQLKEFRKGLGILVKESGAGVVPLYLEGAYKAWPRGRAFPLPAAVTVKVGAFAPWNRLVVSGQDEDYSAIAEAVRKRVENIMKS
ncbi:MAG: 1-acyl-sn-glycerol-3-phosphate acyltransferase, partial [Candidatus Omnitrophica bacterium]|nr:1-acyl-sn-glycerol-3-phosphate acyltransferase [Candidatus Omnitrophota bacterium]